MAYQFPPDIDERVDEYVAAGKFANKDDVLREAIDLLDRSCADYESIERGIADMQAGRARPADESNAEFRATHGIPST